MDWGPAAKGGLAWRCPGVVSVQAPDGEQLSAGSSRQKPHSMGSWLMGTQTGLMAAASRWGLPAQPAHHPDLLLTGRRGGLGCLL